MYCFGCCPDFSILSPPLFFLLLWVCISCNSLTQQYKQVFYRKHKIVNHMMSSFSKACLMMLMMMMLMMMVIFSLFIRFEGRIFVFCLMILFIRALLGKSYRVPVAILAAAVCVKTINFPFRFCSLPIFFFIYRWVMKI